MENINLPQEYYFSTEPDSKGNYTQLCLTEEDNKVVLYGWEPDLDCEDFVCLAEGALPVFKDLVSSISWCHSHNKQELGGIYKDALNVLVNKFLTQEEVKKFGSIVDLKQLS